VREVLEPRKALADCPVDRRLDQRAVLVLDIDPQRFSNQRGGCSGYRQPTRARQFFDLGGCLARHMGRDLLGRPRPFTERAPRFLSARSVILPRAV